MAERIHSMTVEDFARHYQSDGPFELADGEMFKLSPTIFGHSVIIKRVLLAIHASAEAASSGEVFSETPFVLTDDTDWVKGSRTPDVMFISAGRLAAYREDHADWADRPLMLVPDVVIEVISPTDRYSDIQDKVQGYLRDGVRAVWVFDPRRKRVMAYRGEQLAILESDQVLAGGQIIPGFEMRVADLFE